MADNSHYGDLSMGLNRPQLDRWTLEARWCEECGWQDVSLDGPDLNDEAVEVMRVSDHERLMANALAEIPAVREAVRRHDQRPRITHGRHCVCSSCAREDWTNPDLAPCGMHGEDCPAMYQPWGVAGAEIPQERRNAR